MLRSRIPAGNAHYSVSCQKMRAKKVPHFMRNDIAHEKSPLRQAEQEFRQIAGGLYNLWNWFISGISIIQLLEKHVSSGLLFVVLPGEVKAVKEELGRISAGYDGPGCDFSVLIENGDDLDTIAVTQQGPA